MTALITDKREARISGNRRSGHVYIRTCITRFGACDCVLVWPRMTFSVNVAHVSSVFGSEETTVYLNLLQLLVQLSLINISCESSRVVGFAHGALAIYYRWHCRWQMAHCQHHTSMLHIPPVNTQRKIRGFKSGYFSIVTWPTASGSTSNVSNVHMQQDTNSAHAALECHTRQQLLP